MKRDRKKRYNSLVTLVTLAVLAAGWLLQEPASGTLDELSPNVAGLRHTFAVASIRAGDDIKTIQENLGHATSSFTLDVYGHVTEQMRRESANRMESYIDNILQLKGENKGEKLKIG